LIRTYTTLRVGAEKALSANVGFCGGVRLVCHIRTDRVIDSLVVLVAV